MAYAIPNEEERRQLFYYLKRGSSYTAWAKLGPYYKAFVDIVRVAFEDTQNNPPEGKSPLIPQSDMALLLNGYASYENAVARLGKGDKTVFKFVGYGQPAAPHFCEAFRVITVWNQSLWLEASHGGDFPVGRSKFWPQIERALNHINDARFVCGCLQDRYTDVPAPYDDMADLRDGTVLDFLPMLRITPNFPEVPVPKEDVLVRTGDSVPCFGIWEPVKAPLSKGFIGMFKRPEVPPDHKFELDGLMNYLHQGTAAPTIGFEADDYRKKGRPTVWRLIWADDRYEDGTIPTEELEYKFEEPQDRPPPPPPPTEPDITYVFSGQPAPEAGTWACEVDLTLRVRLKKGEPLPRRAENETVTWVHVPDV